MWCVGTILTGVLSFMLEDTPTQGSVEGHVSDAEKRALAAASMEYNLKEPKFRSLFPNAAEALAAAIAAGSEKAAAADGADVAEEKLAPGTKVTIAGIKSRPEINGQTGLVKEYLAARERYTVQLEDGEELALRLAALTPQ